MKRPEKLTLDFEQVLAYIHSKWWMPEWGFSHKGRRVELHTGGWSENETLIRWLQTTMFWFICWEKSVRGGHYYFKMPKKGAKI